MPQQYDKAFDRTPTLRSRDLRTNATPPERLLWARIRNRQLLGVRFNRQVPIGPFICDFAARTERLIVELDGGQHAAQTDADARRTAVLEAQGYAVLRFWNNDVVERMDGVLTAIAQRLENRPSPNPSRKREGDL